MKKISKEEKVSGTLISCNVPVTIQRICHEYWLDETFKKHEGDPTCSKWKPYAILYTYPMQQHYIITF